MGGDPLLEGNGAVVEPREEEGFLGVCWLFPGGDQGEVVGAADLLAVAAEGLPFPGVEEVPFPRGEYGLLGPAGYRPGNTGLPHDVGNTSLGVGLDVFAGNEGAGFGCGLHANQYSRIHAEGEGAARAKNFLLWRREGGWESGISPARAPLPRSPGRRTRVRVRCSHMARDVARRVPSPRGHHALSPGRAPT